jgi:hypothetical protein
MEVEAEVVATATVFATTFMIRTFVLSWMPHGSKIR